jgi:hypothetical protein
MVLCFSSPCESSNARSVGTELVVGDLRLPEGREADVAESGASGYSHAQDFPQYRVSSYLLDALMRSCGC